MPVMMLKLVLGNAAIAALALTLWHFFQWSGPAFALGVIAGSVLWHLAYSLHTGSWD